MKTEKEKSRFTPNRENLTMILLLFMYACITPTYATNDSISANITVRDIGSLSTVTIYGQLIVDGMPKEGAVVGIVVSKDGTKNVFADEVTTNTTGYYTTTFKIDNTEGSTYRAYATPASIYAENIIAIRDFTVGCIEQWDCTAWTSCNSNLIQSRTCTDRNSCGTVYEKPATSRQCTCEVIDGEICSRTETCYGSYMEASDSDRCCSGYCYTKADTSGSTSSSSGSSSSTTTTTTTTSSTDDDDDNEEDSQDTDTSENQQTTDITDMNITDNETAGQTEDINSTSEDTTAQADTDETPTGKIETFFIESRWILTDIILIIIIAVLGLKILSRKGTKTEENPDPRQKGKYSYTPKAKTDGTFVDAVRFPATNRPQAKTTEKSTHMTSQDNGKNTTTKIRVIVA